MADKVKQSEAERERLWLLARTWARFGGWSRSMLTARKWLKHEQTLLRQGLIEANGEPADEGTLFRITDAGRRALGGDHGRG